jgi:hypothetical protein
MYVCMSSATVSMHHRIGIGSYHLEDIPKTGQCRAQWPRGLRHEPSSHARGMDVYVCLFCVYVVLCVGIGLVTG